MGSDLLEKPDIDDEENTPSRFTEDTPQSVYDDEFDKIIAAQDNKKLSAKELKDKESDNNEIGSDSSGNSENNWITNLKSKKNKKGGANKKLLLAGGGGLGLLLMMIGILFLFLGDLKIDHIAQNITTWNIARTARNYRRSLVQNTTEVGAIGEMEAGRYNALKARFGESRVGQAIERINQYRPQKVAENFGSTVKPVFSEGEDRILGLGKKQIFEGFEVDGHFISKADSNFFHPIANRREKIRFAAEMQVAMEESNHGANSLVKSRAMKKVLSDRGIKLYWWEKKGKTYNNAKNQAQAERRSQVESAERVRQDPDSNCAVSQVCSAADDVAETIDEELDKAKEELDDPDNHQGANALAQETEDAAIDTLEASVRTSAVQKILSFASTTYGVAVPLCLIFEGSIHDSSGDDIDAASDSNMRAYGSIQSAADQQESGDTTAWAVAGFNGKLGDVSDSVPLKRQTSTPIDSATQINPVSQPQSSSVGAYTLFDAFLADIVPADVLGAANHIAEKSCGFLTNEWVGGIEAAAEIALALFSAGASKEASASVGQAIRLGLTEIIDQSAKEGIIFAFRELGIKAGVDAVSRAGGRFILKTGVFVGATIGLTELAKLAVLKKANEHNNGLETDATYVNQADMGANLYYNENERAGLYGRPLTTPEVAESNQLDVAYIQEHEARKSFTERYFALSNASSMVTRLGYMAQSGLSSRNSLGLRSLQSIGSVFRTGPAILGNLSFSAKTHAATVSGSGDYNNIQWGWSGEEEALIDNDDDYSPMMNKLILEESGKKDEIENEYKDCYEKTMGSILSDGDVKRNGDGSVKSSDGKCSPDNLGLANDSYGENMVFRWRLSKRNDLVLDHLLELQDPVSDDGDNKSEAGNSNIYVIGDSITVGMRDNGDLAKKLSDKGWNVKNPIDAVGGKALNWGIDTIGARSDLNDVGTVVINLGTNDSATPDDQFRQRVDDMVAAAKRVAPNAKILWTNLYGEGSAGPPALLVHVDFDTRYPELNAILEEKSQEHGFEIIPWASSQEAKDYVGDNDVHPSGKYPEMANWLVDQIGDPPKSNGSLPEGTVPESETEVTSGCGGIRVHKSIKQSVEDLCSAAAADGLNLTGGGWRDPEQQIALRKQNCPDWQNSPASACSPPTAKPGTSMHERGLAIDFKNCSTHSTACFTWLAANAERFGFKNLPSEAWHWSTTGS
ncbi:D-alanyl-D-alanine carboxypeptidase family protein [Candidatus Saccharibacteria bacterium]|nr:D-alanyl-D-alanine carboxypeptidase family protein [Candidatus Saccharibacteria bacterium]